MFNLLAQATTQISESASSAMSSASVSSTASSAGNVVLNAIDQVQKMDINQVAKYCLGIVGFIWFVMVVWVFFDARRRYVHFFTALIITLLCAIPVIGMAFLLLYAIMRPELTVKEWEVMHTNYAKLELMTQGRFDRALPMPEKTEKTSVNTAEKVAIAADTKKISNAEVQIQEIKNMTEEVKDVKSEVEKMVDQVGKLQESLQDKVVENIEAKLPNKVEETSSTAPSNDTNSEIINSDTQTKQNRDEEIVATAMTETPTKQEPDLEIQTVPASEVVKTETKEIVSDVKKPEVEKKNGILSKIINFFSEE